MKQNIKMFKEWYKLAKPHKGFWIFQFVTVIIPSICLLCESLYGAKATTNLANGNFEHAIFCIILVLVFAFLRAFAADLNYRNTYPLVQNSFMNIQKKIFNKIIKSKNKNFLNNSKEKLINIVHTDAYDVSFFSDVICTKCRFLFSIILTLTYVFLVNYKIGFIVIFIILINYFVVNIINNQVAKAKRIVKESIDQDYEAFSELINSKEIISDLNITGKVKNDYLEANQRFMDAKHLYNTKASYLDNYFFIFYKSLIFVVTLFMVYLLKNDVVNLTIYLVIVTYLTDSVTNSKDFLSLFTELKNAYIATNRVKIILNFDEKDKLDFGTLNKDDVIGELDFVNVSYNEKNSDYPTVPIKNITLRIKPYKFYLFYGEKNNGKRTLFYLMRRAIKPSSGEIYLDKVNIFDYNNKVFSKNVNYLTNSTYLFNKTIIENLKMTETNTDKIKEYCASVGILKSIEELPLKFNSSIDLLSEKDKYYLSLVRMLLLESEIIMIYELPSYFNNTDILNYIELLKKIAKKRTVILFSGKKEYTDLIDNVYEIDDGKLTRIK